MHDADAQCTLGGGEEAKGQRKSLMFKFFLCCLKMWIFYYIIIYNLKKPNKIVVVKGIFNYLFFLSYLIVYLDLNFL